VHHPSGLPRGSDPGGGGGANPRNCFTGSSLLLVVSNPTSKDPAADADLRARLARAEKTVRDDGHHVLASELTLGLLHKLNNLMTGVYFNLEGAEAALDPAHPAAGLVREVASAIQQAQALVRRTADLNLAPDPEASYFDLGALIQESWELMKLILPKSTVADFVGPDQPLYVKVSSEEFSEALLQLASATRAAYREGESHVAVEVRPLEALDLSGFHPPPVTMEGGVAVIYRDDAGEPAERGNTHLFQAFNDERGSIGSRLYRARELVRKQNGSLSVRTVQGGMEFVIALPGVS
jgi:hypothetical protein